MASIYIHLFHLSQQGVEARRLLVASPSERGSAVLPFGDELMDLKLLNQADSPWLSHVGRDLAAAHLLPRAEAVLRQELADAVKRARQGHSSSSSGWRAL
jgi:hypothetical protein